MNRVSVLILNRIKLLFSYFKSFILGFLNKRKYRYVKEFCLFIGYPRSGHTMIASLLNAHPNIMIALEWGTFNYLNFGFRRNQILYCIIRNSWRYTRYLNNCWTGYSYNVPDSWQGKYSRLLVVGDKFGGRTTLMLEQSSEFLDMLSNTLKIQTKLVHIIRNPFDVISTSLMRSSKYQKDSNAKNLVELLFFINVFFTRADIIKRIKEEGKYKMIDIYHEEFIKNPVKELESLIQFLELNADRNYYESCAKIAFDEPNKSRYSIEWTKELINFVETNLKKYDFLSNYKYSD